MPAAAAAPFFWGAIASAGGAIGGAALSARASGKAAQAQTQAATAASNAQIQAANEAARLQKESNDAALRFQQQEAAYARAENARTDRANYDQWAAKQGYISSLGQQIGLPARNLPAYVPPSGAGTAEGSPSGAPAGPLPPAPKDLQSAIQQANQIAYGGRNKHDDPNYWASMWEKDPGYTWRRLLGEGAGGADVATSGPYSGKAAPASAPTAARRTAMPLSTVAPPSAYRPAAALTPPLQRRTFGDYL